MKLKKKQDGNLPVNSDRRIRLTHGQSIKQSANYQSADCSYSAELVVPDTPKSIKTGIRRLEKIVEGALALKVKQQYSFLHQISEQRDETAHKKATRRSGF